MKPYYQDEWVTIYHGDCREILPELPETDLALLDPPINKWLDVPLFTFSRCFAFTNPQNRHDTEVTLGRPKNEIVWHFTDGRWVSKKLPRITHEYIYVYGKMGDAMVGDYNKNKKPIKKGEVAIGRDSYSKRIYTPKERKQLNSVMITPKIMGKDLGIWGKPEKLITALLEWAGFDIVLDPFLGSGTTAYCAKKLNRKCIGIEIEEKYCEIAAKRCSQTVMTLNI